MGGSKAKDFRTSYFLDRNLILLADVLAVRLARFRRVNNNKADLCWGLERQNSLALRASEADHMRV